MVITKMTLNFENIKDLELFEFYEYVAFLLGVDTSLNNTIYDCTKMDVAKNIEDNFYELYRKKGASDWEITMGLLQSGAKVDHTLQDNEVVVSEGFVTYKEGCVENEKEN